VSEDSGQAYLEEVRRAINAYKGMAENAMLQVNEEEMFRQIDPESNSIALLVKHLAGNMRSRWTDFLTSDGEKPTRHREQEFENSPGSTRADVMRWWEEGWQRFSSVINALKPEDLQRTVSIRGEQYSVLKAINVASLHYAYHIGQIVLLAKHFRANNWKSLSIPKPGQEVFKPAR